MRRILGMVAALAAAAALAGCETASDAWDGLFDGDEQQALAVPAVDRTDVITALTEAQGLRPRFVAGFENVAARPVNVPPPGWVVPPGNAMTLVNVASDVPGVAHMASQVPPPGPGQEQAISVALPAEVAQALPGRRIRVIAYARQTATEPSQSFAMAYQGGGEGSGWATFRPGSQLRAYNFVYDVPATPTREGRIAIWPDTSGQGRGIVLLFAAIELVE